MELDADADTLAAALSLVDSDAGHLSTDLAGPLHSFAPPDAVFAPLGDFSDAPGDLEASWHDVSPSPTPLPARETSAAAAEARETEGTDSDGRRSSSGSSQDVSPGRTQPKPGAGRRRQSTGQAKKRPLNYNPNRARDAQRKELLALRTEASTLASQLASLENVARKRLAHSTPGASASMDKEIAQFVWKAIAERQLERRLGSTRENADLKEQVRANGSTIHRMAKLLRSYKAESAAHTFSIEHYRLLEGVDLKLDPAFIQRLTADVAKCYRDVDSVFRDCYVDLSQVVSFSAPEMQTDADGNLFARVQAAKVFPYDTHSTGMAAWTQFSQSVRPNARCFFAEVVEHTDSLVVERFCTELHMDNDKIVVRVRQVKRRYMEADRVVVVWRSVVDPIEFRGQRLKGVSFEERGFFLIHRPPQLPSGFSLLQSCYLMSPNAMRSIPQHTLALAMTDFVLSWMASSIPTNHQFIEDILLERSLVPGARG